MNANGLWWRILVWGSGGVAGVWAGLSPVYTALVILMALDYVSGILAAFIGKKLDSAVGFRGLAKKAMILIAVAAVAILAANFRAAGLPVDVPAGEVAAGGFALNELVSILTNLGRSGVPLPKPLADALAVLAPKKPEP